MKILIVDDELIARMSAEKFLKEYGNCDLAEDGNHAVDAVKLSLEQKEPYDFISLDVDMPNLSGQQALEQIRELEEQHGYPPGKGAKVMMLTSHRDSDAVTKAYDSFCDVYTTKPISAAVIKRQLILLGLLDEEA